MTHAFFFFFFFYNIIDYNWTTQKIHEKYFTKSREGVDARGKKKWIYIFKAKERKQYQNNGTENLFVVIMYLKEAFKMRLLSITGSFESPRRSNSTFKWLRKFLKDEYVNEEGPSSIFKIEVAQEKMFIVFNL